MIKMRVLSLLMCNMILFSGSSLAYAENSKELKNINSIEEKEIKKDDLNKSISINNDFFNEITGEYHIVGKIAKVEDEDNGKYITVERNGAPMEVLINGELVVFGGFENIKEGYFIDIRGKESEKGRFIIGEKCIVSKEPITIKSMLEQSTSIRSSSNIDYVILNYYQIKDENLEHVFSNNKRKSGACLLEDDDVYYVLLSGGECPTGGYVLDIKSVNLSEGKLDITYDVVPPSQDMMVTSALTYPSKIIKISKEKKIEKVNAVKVGNSLVPIRKQVIINKNTTIGEIEEAVKKINNPQDKLKLMEKLINWTVELF